MKHHATILKFMQQMQGKGIVDATDLRWLRGLAFNHKCRSDHPAEMIANLIPIYTVLAVKERLTA